MQCERGYSIVSLQDVVMSTKLDSLTIRSIAPSLIEKGLLYINERKDEWGIEPDMHIWFLEGDAEGLVEHWQEEGAEPAKLILSN